MRCGSNNKHEARRIGQTHLHGRCEGQLALGRGVVCCEWCSGKRTWSSWRWFLRNASIAFATSAGGSDSCARMAAANCGTDVQTISIIAGYPVIQHEIFCARQMTERIDTP